MDITLLKTRYRLFTACGKLYENGLQGRLRVKMSKMHFHYIVPGDDFTRAGEASSA